MSTLVNPESKIGPLLDAHPELERVLIGLSPEFRRLQNPLLRRTVARVATVGQVARIGGLPVSGLVKALRAALGEAQTEGNLATEEAAESEPAWAAAARPAVRVDADAVLARGGTPVGEVMSLLTRQLPGDVVALSVTFYPAPLVEAVRAKGYDAFARKTGNGWEVLIREP